VTEEMMNALETGSIQIVEVDDERLPLARDALGLIERAFPPSERQPIEQIAMEISEKRLGLLTSYDFHLFAAVSPEGRAVGVSSGIYLSGVNVGLITYLAVDPEYRDESLGRTMRLTLTNAFGRDAFAHDSRQLAAIVGEVRLESPWLQRLVRERSVLPLDLGYYHPGETPTEDDARWILYREPVADRRRELPTVEVRRMLYAIYRRAYRVRWPLAHPSFRAMLEELEGREFVSTREVEG
jgi:hypothetical protein